MKQVIQILQNLLEQLEKSSNVPAFCANLWAAQSRFSLDKSMCNALEASAKGNPDAINEWLWALPSDWKQPIAWLSTVKRNGTKAFVWMVGFVDSKSQTQVRTLIDSAWTDIAGRSVFCGNAKRPPFLMYLSPVAVSQWQTKQENTLNLKGTKPQFASGHMFVEATAVAHNIPLTPEKSTESVQYSAIAIFQTNYEGENVLEDIDQKMPLNVKYLHEQMKFVYKVIQQSCDAETVAFYRDAVLPNEKLITKLHAELHNYGHFMGPWDYTKAGKTCEVYEAIEEFRACLVPGVVVDTLDVSDNIKKGLALHIFFTRVFNYGMKAYFNAEKNVSVIREMNVGRLFFELLRKEGMVNIIEDKVYVDLDALNDGFLYLLAELHKYEKNMKAQGKKGLECIAKNYYTEIGDSAGLFDVYAKVSF